MFLSRQPRYLAVAAVSILALAVAACSTNATAGGAGQCKKTNSPVITLAAYSNVYDTYGKLTSSSGTFVTDWKDKHNGQTPIFQASYGGSTTQAENVVNGFGADIVALSLDPDVEMIQKAGLITHNWKADPHGSHVATAAVVFDVRPGNPKHIQEWNDLTQPGLKILTPDPAQSGGAKWNIVAAYGAAMRGQVPGYKANDPADAERLLEGIFRNVTVMDKSANDSLKNFDSGNGDVAITYDYALQQAKAAGGEDQMVVPPSTVAIQSPTVVVDENAKEHCVLPIANAFVKYLRSSDAQDTFQSVGFERPINVAQATKGTDTEPPIKDFFTTDQLGGWDRLQNDTVFGPDGAFTKAFKGARG